jgi:uncharacterized protein
MKIYTIVLSLFGLIISSYCQKIDGNKTWVFDYEDVLTINQERTLDSIIANFEKATTNEILIVTTKDIGEHEKPMSYAVDFGNKHGVGKKGKDNGLVIFFSRNLRQTFLATGYGTEKILKDEICKSIIDSCMIPLFKEEKYYDGLKAGVEAAISRWK